MSLPNKVAPQPHQPAAPCLPYTLVPICSPGGATRKALSGPWSSKASLVMGIVQVILGVLLIVAQIVLFAKHTVGGVHGLGFVCGVLFIVTGAFAIAAGKNPTKCLVVTVMVLSIVSASFTTTLFIGGSVAMVVDQHEYENGHYGYRHDDTRYGCYCDESYYNYHYYDDMAFYTSSLSPYSSTLFSSILPSTTKPCQYICVDPPYSYFYNNGLKRLMLSLHGLMLVFALVELIIAVVASALACRASCCGTSQPQQYAYAFSVHSGQQIPTGMMADPGMMQGNPSGQIMSVPEQIPELSNVHGATGTRPPSYTSLADSVMEPDLTTPEY